MSRINFDDLPISSDQARAARNYFGWPQAKAAEESGLPLHKLKRFEAGNFIPDPEFLTELRAFFEKRGYKFEDTQEPGHKAKKAGVVFPAGVVGSDEEVQSKALDGRPAKATVHHMRIALADPEMGHVLDLIELNEEKAAELLVQPVSVGLWEGFSDKTEAQHGEVLKLLAANGLLFAKLFGREVGGKPSSEVLAGKVKPRTQADLLHRGQADTHLAAAGDPNAKERAKARKPAASLMSAIFG